MLNGAYIRAVPGHQVRNFEAICGKVDREGHPPRRFALVRSVVEQPHALLRAALQDQGWRDALEPPPSVPSDQAQIDVERLRHLLWNGHHEKACEALAS